MTFRIAIIISHPIQHFCPWFANLAKSNEWQIKVFFASAAGVKTYFDPNFGKEIEWNNLYLDEFEYEFLNDSKVIPITPNLDANTLEERLNKYDPDAILIFGYSQKLQRRAYNWAKKAKKKIIYFGDSELRHYRPFYKKFLKYFFLKEFFKGIDAFLTIGDANEAYYRYYGVPDHRLFRSAYPIDIRSFEAAFKDKRNLNIKARDELSINSNDFVMSVVGKLVKWKRQIDIIKAVALLDNEFNNIKLLIIGTGEMENELKNEAEKVKKNKIIFLGFINPTELVKYYAATNLYVHPSEVEPHSVAISEAIYMGCPVLISDKCGSYGPNDDVQNGYNGLVFQCGNINDLANKIKYLILNNNLLTYFEMNSRKYAINSQSLAHYTGFKKILNFINSMK